MRRATLLVPLLIATIVLAQSPFTWNGILTIPTTVPTTQTPNVLTANVQISNANLKLSSSIEPVLTVTYEDGGMSASIQDKNGGTITYELVDNDNNVYLSASTTSLELGGITSQSITTTVNTGGTEGILTIDGGVTIGTNGGISLATKNVNCDPNSPIKFEDDGGNTISLYLTGTITSDTTPNLVALTDTNGDTANQDTTIYSIEVKDGASIEIDASTGKITISSDTLLTDDSNYCYADKIILSDNEGKTYYLAVSSNSGSCDGVKISIVIQASEMKFEIPSSYIGGDNNNKLSGNLELANNKLTFTTSALGLIQISGNNLFTVNSITMTLDSLKLIGSHTTVECSQNMLTIGPGTSFVTMSCKNPILQLDYNDNKYQIGALSVANFTITMNNYESLTLFNVALEGHPSNDLSFSNDNGNLKLESEVTGTATMEAQVLAYATVTSTKVIVNSTEIITTLTSTIISTILNTTLTSTIATFTSTVITLTNTLLTLTQTFMTMTQVTTTTTTITTVTQSGVPAPVLLATGIGLIGKALRRRREQRDSQSE